MVLDLPGSDIRCSDVECQGIFLKCLAVKDIQPVRQIMVAKLNAIQIPGSDKRANGTVSGIPGILLVVPNGPSDLFRFKIASKCCACRYAGSRIKFNPVLEEDIKDAAGKHSPHRAAFHTESTLHPFSLFPSDEQPGLSA